MEITMTASLFWWVCLALMVGLFVSAAWDPGPSFNRWPRWLRRRPRQPRLMGFTLLAGTLFALLLRDWYVAFDRDVMAVSEFWTLGIEHRRPYTEVRKVRLKPRGTRAEGSLEIRFAWGIPWTDYQDPGEPWNTALVDLRHIGAFVASRAGVPFEDKSGEWLEFIERARQAERSR